MVVGSASLESEGGRRMGKEYLTCANCRVAGDTSWMWTSEARAAPCCKGCHQPWSSMKEENSGIDDHIGDGNVASNEDEIYILGLLKRGRFEEAATAVVGVRTKGKQKHAKRPRKHRQPTK